MQKISSYLYPNRINVVADVALFPMRWNIVYQNRVKIYQGVDNILTLDVKNSDQKRIDISNMTLKMSLTDILGKDLATVAVVPGATTGLATMTIAEAVLVNVTPQFLNFVIYRVNANSTKTVLYADTQFGAKGNIELVGSILAISTPKRYITRFNPITDDRTQPYTIVHYSDAVDVRKSNQLTAASAESVFFDFDFNKSDALVTIQFTEEVVVSATTIWTDVMAFGVFPGDIATTKRIAYPVYNRNIQWARIKFIQISYNGTGATVDIIKKNISGPHTEYTFNLNQPGNGYKIGEVYAISGLRVGGLTQGGWILTVASVDALGGVKQWTPLAEQPVIESGDIAYKNIPVTDPAHFKSVDKVTIRL